MIVLIYAAAYAFYNVHHLNILYSVVPWNQGTPQNDALVRFLYAAAALLATVGAVLLTWSAAYRPPRAIKETTAFSIAAPFRLVRSPHYLSYFALILALGTFQSRLGFPVMLLTETILLLRLVGRKSFASNRSMASDFGSTRSAFRAFSPRLVRGSKTTASHHNGAKLSGTRPFNGASSRHFLPSRGP
jgi:protein-S-isoprenylcysteine O-methyltransferase Ste14